MALHAVIDPHHFPIFPIHMAIFSGSIRYIRYIMIYPYFQIFKHPQMVVFSFHGPHRGCHFVKISISFAMAAPPSSTIEALKNVTLW